MYEELTCDFLVLGSGGAGLMAALHAYDANPRLKIVLAAKGLVGKSGCTRLVHGFNAVLDPRDSLEAHFRDTVRAGGFINNQELVWELVNGAPRVITELETKFGCFFYRQDDGHLQTRPMGAQSFQRTLHRGDYTGIEIIGRLHDQLFARQITLLDETRAIELVPDSSGRRIVGALLLDLRTGEFLLARARVVLLATGGGARMFRFSAASFEKSGDGVAMAYRAGCELVDMEMTAFLPMGIVAGASRQHGLVLEEGLRYAGGYLINGLGERFMARYDPQQMERAPMPVVSRANYTEIVEGRGTPDGGVLLDVRHLGSQFLRSKFPSIVENCAAYGFDITAEPVTVAPSAHFHIGGAKIDKYCRSTLEGLLVAGEDAGGVHGAFRLGGNSSAESTVFGARAGDMAAELCRHLDLARPDRERVEAAMAQAIEPLGRPRGEDPFALLDSLQTLMWERVGLVRDADGVRSAIAELRDMEERADLARAPAHRRWNLAWQQALNIRNLVLVARLTAEAALYRQESRGAHFRRDFPELNDERWLVNVHQRRDGEADLIWDEPVALSRMRPEREVARP